VNAVPSNAAQEGYPDELYTKDTPDAAVVYVKDGNVIV
jgi:hypothetical protein